MAAAARFQRRQRLCQGAQFERVFARPFRSADRHFTILARANETGIARLGLVVGKRVDKRAVARNRLKRVIRESFRHQPTLASNDYVVIAKAPAALKSLPELTVILNRLWSRFESPPTAST